MAGDTGEISCRALRQTGHGFIVECDHIVALQREHTLTYAPHESTHSRSIPCYPPQPEKDGVRNVCYEICFKPGGSDLTVRLVEHRWSDYTSEIQQAASLHTLGVAAVQ